jgi:phosphoribosylformimino-5-aminoimidazole carboxamide ribotide isomerase
MRIYPAIDLREGSSVQLVGGDPRVEKVHEPDPVRVAHRWFGEGATLLHVVDLDAALGHGSNLDVVARIIRSVPCPVQLGGGIRHLVDIQRRIDLGVGRVIIGTQGVENPHWLELAADIYPGRIVLAVDARGEEVAVRGWQEGSGISIRQVLSRVEDMDLAGLLYTNVDVEGRLEGIDSDAVERVVSATRHKVIASGGITSMEDLDRLNEIGVDGAVLGMSIYTGRIVLKDAIERIEGRKVSPGRNVLIPPVDVHWGAGNGGLAAAEEDAEHEDEVEE